MFSMTPKPLLRRANRSGVLLSAFLLLVAGLILHTGRYITRGCSEYHAHFQYAAASGPNQSTTSHKNATSSYNDRLCLLDSGLHWNRMNESSAWTVMSTVEAHPFPTGIQARCDMVIGSRYTKFHPDVRNDAWYRTWHPRTVFVRNDRLQFFISKVLPCLAEPFVLLTGDSDLTLPRQIDLRFPKVLEMSEWDKLVQDDRVLHMFVENLDTSYSKVSGLPLGVSAYNYPGRKADYILDYVRSELAQALPDRPLRAMHVARMRDGKGQWADRQLVQDLCTREWAHYCESPTGINTTQQMWQTVQNVTFVLCVHGGGLDPSPKAWEALLLGSIPVIQHFAGDDAYQHLPVVFVDSWHERSVTPKAMEQWRQKLLPWFVEPSKRAEVLQRLSLEFWWLKIEAAVHGQLHEFAETNEMLSLEWRSVPGSPSVGS